MTQLNLRAMGFCGADDSVAPELMCLLSQHYPWVEWGVLFRPDKEGLPRYASTAWVQKLSDARKRQTSPDSVRLAAHLCGARCQEVLSGNYTFVQELQAWGFGRVQINATAANNVRVDTNDIANIVANIRTCMRMVPDIEYILQCNEETKAIWQPFVADPVPNMSVLFDPSCGLGVQIREFPVPLSDPHIIRCGYAGGMGPSNIASTLTTVTGVSQGVPVWVDMESSLRVRVLRSNASSTSAEDSYDDHFSIDKCYQCVLIGVQQFGLPQLL
jgi:hypothetical protein